jgi:hypothetical protein
MKVIIAGSRFIRDVAFVEQIIESANNIPKYNITELVSGCAQGVKDFQNDKA